MASAANPNPFASLINKSLTEPMGASGAANPFLQRPDALAASGDVGSDGSWTDEEPSFLHMFKTLPRRSRARQMSIIKRSLTRKRINNPSSQVAMQCMRGEDGKYYYIPIDPYNPSHLEIIDKLSPLLVNPTPLEFQKGALYTFILASVITKDAGTGADVELVPPKLYACQTQNIFEFGTKHHHIFFRMALTNELASVARDSGIDEKKVEYGLYASGEIKCITPTKLMVNFFSGTYEMKRNIKLPKFPKYRKGVPYEIDDMKKLMRQIDRNYKIKYNSAPFITSESVPITQKQMDFLNSHGIPTFGFDSEGQCREMKIHVMRVKNIEKRIVGFEEMREKYKELNMPQPEVKITSRFSQGIYAMTTDELIKYANGLGVPIPSDSDKYKIRELISQHLKSKGLGGGARQTIKRKRVILKKNNE